MPRTPASCDDDSSHLRLAADLAGIDVAEIVTPTSRDVVVDGLRLHYLDWGNHDAPAVLFLHGGALTAHTWDLVCLALRDRYRCIALDLRGHGDSEWSPGMRYSLADHVADVRGLADAVGLEGFAVVGQSLGAMTGLALAQRRPFGLAALVMVDAGPEVSQSAVHRVRDFVLGRSEFSSVDEIVAHARSFNPRRSGQLLRRSLLHNVRQLDDGRWTWKYDRRHLGPEELDRLRAEFAELADQLDRVACPVLVVRGADSDVLSDRSAADLAGRFGDGAWARVERAAHTVQGDNPAGLVEVLQGFLARSLRARRSRQAQASP
jgi:pimeloyl-ACP methyl ester carboxylesterase